MSPEMQKVRADDGRIYIHKEAPSRLQPKPSVRTVTMGITESVDQWDNGLYYGLVIRYSSGFPIGGGPYAMLSISACDETARHDWRDYQQLKNFLVGDEWEAVELYPAESRLRDPSNRFYLWCVPKGVFAFGLPPARSVLNPSESDAPQRPFPKGEAR